jgi:hypothetical protein
MGVGLVMPWSGVGEWGVYVSYGRMGVGTVERKVSEFYNLVHVV